jgi:hypothetical protein
MIETKLICNKKSTGITVDNVILRGWGNGTYIPNS